MKLAQGGYGSHLQHSVRCCTQGVAPRVLHGLTNIVQHHHPPVVGLQVWRCRASPCTPRVLQGMAGQPPYACGRAPSYQPWAKGRWRAQTPCAEPVGDPVVRLFCWAGVVGLGVGATRAIGSRHKCTLISTRALRVLGWRQLPRRNQFRWYANNFSNNLRCRPRAQKPSPTPAHGRLTPTYPARMRCLRPWCYTSAAGPIRGCIWPSSLVAKLPRVAQRPENPCL
jgi:hypothetical protein